MDAEQTIAEIERVEGVFGVPDAGPLTLSGPSGCESKARRKADAYPVFTVRERKAENTFRLERIVHH